MNLFFCFYTKLTFYRPVGVVLSKMLVIWKQGELDLCDAVNSVNELN